MNLVMKVIIKVFIVLIAFVMLTATVLFIFTDPEILFVRESAAYLSRISVINRGTSVLFFIVYLLLTVLSIKRFGISKILALLLVLVLWIFSGRVVAFKAFPDGRIITGWYYIETDKFNLCENDIDCEGVIAKEFKVTNLPLWRINIKTNTFDKTVFVGPFVSKSWERVLGKQIGK